MIIQIMRAEKCLPDDFWCIAMVQELACLMAKIEPLLADSQMATLLGCVAFIARQGKVEMAAAIETTMLFGRIRSENTK